MTYKESYMLCKTEEELLSTAKNDIRVAFLMGSHARVSVIKKAVEEVIAEKFGENSQ